MTDPQDTDQTPTLEEIAVEELDGVSGGAVNEIPTNTGFESPAWG